MTKLNKKTARKKISSTQPAAGSYSLFSNHISHFCIFVFAFLLYSNTLYHGFVMDDGAVITNNETVQKGLSGIKELWKQSSVYGSTKENFGTYRPLTMSLFAAEKHFFGNNSFAFHLTHVLLYTVLCVVLYIMLKQLLKEYYPLLPFISAMIFVAHPVHTEVTANVKSADEILSLLFSLLAVIFNIRFIENSSKKYIGISWLCFLLALFSKESAATFLLIIPLSLHIFTTAKKKNILVVFVLHLSAVLIYLLARNSALDKAPEGIAVINNTLAGAKSFSERYATIFVILLHYLKLLFYPHPLAWDYGYNQIPLVGFGNMKAIISFLIYSCLGSFAFAVIFLRKKFSILNSQFSILTAFCILFFLISISVSSNILVLIGSTMAERFLFTPSLAFCIVVAFTLTKAPFLSSASLRREDKSAFLPFGKVAMSFVFIILLLFSYKTFTRNKDWKNNLTLFAKGVEDCPNSYRTNITFAWESVLAGEKETDKEKKKIRFENAVTYYKKGLAIYDKVAADWYNYGVSNSNVGNIDEAIKSYKRALEINPKHRNSLYNLATVYLSRKDYQNSLNYFLQVFSIEPDFMDVAFKIGLLYHIGGYPQQAIPYYERYLKNNPDNKDVINNLSMAYKSIGDKEKVTQLRVKFQQHKQ